MIIKVHISQSLDKAMNQLLVSALLLSRFIFYMLLYAALCVYIFKLENNLIVEDFPVKSEKWARNIKQQEKKTQQYRATASCL